MLDSNIEIEKKVYLSFYIIIDICIKSLYYNQNIYKKCINVNFIASKAQ